MLKWTASTPWAKRLPRKTYDRTRRNEKQCEALPAPRLEVARLTRKRAAAAPAEPATAEAQPAEPRDRRQPAQCSWAVRVTKGPIFSSQPRHAQKVLLTSLFLGLVPSSSPELSLFSVLLTCAVVDSDAPCNNMQFWSLSHKLGNPAGEDSLCCALAYP